MSRRRDPEKVTNQPVGGQARKKLSTQPDRAAVARPGDDEARSPGPNRDDSSVRRAANKKPDEKTASSSSDLAILRRVFGQARPYWKSIAALFGVSLLATPLALLGPVPLKMAVDNVLGSEPLSGFVAAITPVWFQASTTRLLALVVILEVVVVVLIQSQAAVSRAWTTSMVEQLSLGFRARLLQHAQRLSFAFHDRRGTADSIYRIQYDAPAISNLAVTTTIPFLSAAFTLVAMVFVIVNIHLQLALVALAIAPALYLLGRWYRRRMRPRYRQAKRLESSALGVVQEVLTSFRVVKAFGTEERESHRYESRSSESVDARVRLAVAEGAFGVLVSLTTALGTAGVLYVGVLSVQAGTLTLGEMLLVLSYVAQLYTPLKTISRKVASLQNQMASAARAFDLIDEVPDVVEQPGARRLDRADGNLQLVDVSFAYEPGQPVLQGLSFEVEPGTKVGIAGQTGVGKTTLIGLLVRFYDADSGTIQLDGTDIREYKLGDLRSQFAIMSQEPVLFSTSIAENIAYARTDATPAAIRAAAEAAGVAEFIESLPAGYDTVVGERGMRLSGGERQRISLARAYLKDAPILILDEPTSSVDIETERMIMDALEGLMAGKTTLMIAHRPTTLGVCDVILELGRPAGLST